MNVASAVLTLRPEFQRRRDIRQALILIVSTKNTCFSTIPIEMRHKIINYIPDLRQTFPPDPFATIIAAHETFIANPDQIIKQCSTNNEILKHGMECKFVNGTILVQPRYSGVNIPNFEEYQHRAKSYPQSNQTMYRIYTATGSYYIIVTQMLPCGLLLAMSIDFDDRRFIVDPNKTISDHYHKIIEVLIPIHIISSKFPSDYHHAFLVDDFGTFVYQKIKLDIWDLCPYTPQWL